MKDIIVLSFSTKKLYRCTYFNQFCIVPQCHHNIQCNFPVPQEKSYKRLFFSSLLFFLYSTVDIIRPSLSFSLLSNIKREYLLAAEINTNARTGLVSQNIFVDFSFYKNRPKSIPRGRIQEE